MNKLVHEVLEEARKKRSKAQKIEVLQKNDSGALRDVLRGTYDKTIEWLVPDDPNPPYEASGEHNAPSNFIKECANIRYIVKGGYDDVSLFKREKIYLALLESIHPKDAQLVINMVMKKPIPGITRPIVEEAFPNLLKG
jgi:hypothetical protein